MKLNIVSNHAGRWFGTGYIINPNNLFRRLAGNMPGVLLWLAVLPLAALGQANYATPYTFVTLAGLAGSAGSADGTGSAARFNSPYGVAVDNAGNVYVADCFNNTIRKVTPAGTNGMVEVTTLAGLAGSAGSADGTNSTARFEFWAYANGTNYTGGALAVDTSGNIYVADSSNNTIRKVTPVGTNWVVTTLAGLAGTTGSTDGTNSAARFNLPVSVAVDSAGNLYVADCLNNTIREVTPDGTNWVVTTLAGLAGNFGSADGTNSAARFYWPGAVAVDTNGNLYVADFWNDTIRKVTPLGTNWVVTTLAGTAGDGGSADGTNSVARFNLPASVAVDSVGNLYVGDSVNNTIRKVTPVGTNWVVTTLAGLAGATGSANGTGSAALFNFGDGAGGYVALDSNGNLYVADISNDLIRKGFPPGCVPAPMLQAPSLSSGQFGFGMTGIPSLVVNLESSTDLINWHLVSIKILVGGTNYFVNFSPSQGALFYRAQVR